MNAENDNEVVHEGGVSFFDTLITVGVFLAVAYGGYQYFNIMRPGSVPDIEFAQGTEAFISMRDCELDIATIRCTMSNEQSRRGIAVYRFAAVMYNGDVRVGVSNFPSQNINPGESVRSALAYGSEIDSVDRIVVHFR